MASLGVIVSEALHPYEDVETVSVKLFGAKGDGTTSDTVPFQNAINILEGTGRALFVPDGTYVLSGIDLKGVSLYSSGATIITDGNTANRYLLKDSTTQAIRLGNLTFDGVNAVQDTTGIWQRCMLFEQNNLVTHRDINYINCAGSLTEFKVGVSGGSISGGLVSGCTDANGFIVRGKHIVFTDITFQDCTEHVIRFGRFTSDADIPSGIYCTVNQCSFTNIGNDAVLFELNSSSGVVSNCTAVNCRSLVKAESNAPTEAQKAHHITVSNNICKTGINEASAAIKLNSCKYCIIANNSVDGYYNGLSAGAYSIISENNITNTTYTGISVSGVDTTVSANQIVVAAIGVGVATADNSNVQGNYIGSCSTFGVSIASPSVSVVGNDFKNNVTALRVVSTSVGAVITLNKGVANTTPLVGSASDTYIKNNFGNLSTINIV